MRVVGGFKLLVRGSARAGYEVMNDQVPAMGCSALQSLEELPNTVRSEGTA